MRSTAIWVGIMVMCSGSRGLAKQPDNYPAFSWDRLPLYIHVLKDTAFNQQEVAYLASFPLITFEKSTGMDAYGSTEAGTLAAARAVKEFNPETRILFYRNVMVHYPWYAADQQLADIESPFLVSVTGRTKLVRQRREVYDLSNPKVVSWWTRTAAEACADGVIDGLFLDGNLKALTPTYLEDQLPPGKKAAVTAGYGDLLRQTRAALPPGKLMVANLIRASLPDSDLAWMANLNGSYLENFTRPVGGVSKADYIVRGIEATQAAARQGKIIAMTFGLGDATAKQNGIDETRRRLVDTEGLQPRIDFYLALFLVCAERYSYVYLHDGYNVSTRNGQCLSRMWLKRLPEYDRPLGPPKGPAKRNGYVFTREFAHAAVWVDVAAEKARISWH